MSALETELELRLERGQLLCEREFLLHETETTVCLTTRVTTTRRNAAETDIGLLRAYVEGLRRKDSRACMGAEHGMREKVIAAQRRSEELRKILTALQRETMDIKERCASLSV